MSSPRASRARPGAAPDWTVMERRVLVAIFLSFIVLYAYQAFFVKPVPKPQPGAAATQTAPRPAPRGTTTAAAKPAGAAAPTLPVSTAAALVSDPMEHD